ncbi:MAG: polysaccharide biosynthesis C-terminal domain-containing protein [Polyangiaceae bacterium]|nr:polysaccharide biosynthesis C-terminal domain-containing protein [Polyangiaceae bacterium]
MPPEAGPVPPSHASAAASAPRTTSPGDATAVARGGVVNFLGTASGFVDPLFLVFVSYALGAGTLGSFVLASTYLALVHRITTVGLDKGLLRHVPIARESARPAEEVPAVLATALRFAFGGGVLGAIVVGGLAQIIVGAGGEDPDGHAGWWLAWMAFALPAQTLSTVLLTAVRGTSRMAPFVVVQNFLIPTFQLVLAVLGVALGGAAGALIAAFVISAYLGLLASGVVFLRAFSELRWVALLRAPHRRELIAFSAPQGVTDMMNLLLGRVDIIMIAAFFPGRSELVAIYAIASLLAGTVKKVRLAFDISLAPVLARLLERNARGELARVYQQTGLWVWLLYAFVAGGLCLGAPFALRIAGADYVDAWLVVPILVLGRLVNAAGGLAQTALLMSGRSRLELVNNLLINLVNVALNAVLIPVWGIYGAAIGTSASLTVFGVLRVVQVERLVGLGPHYGRMAGIGAAALVAAVPGCLVHAAVDPVVLAGGLAATTYVLAYPVALWILGLSSELSSAWSFLRGDRQQRRGALEPMAEGVG